MIICGFDPGLNITGYGIITVESHFVKCLDAGIIQTDTKQSLSFRLNQLFDEVSSLLEEFSVDKVAIEELYSHYKHPKTAILMAHARGVILLSAMMKKIDILHFSATQVKKSITGRGRASKYQVKKAVASQLRLNIDEKSPFDVTDALALALCCYEHTK